jgi:hypothetical protein
MPGSAPTRTISLTRSVRRLVGPLVLTAVVCVGATLTSPAPQFVLAGSPKEPGVQSPKTWVHASRTSPVFWWIWSEVRDYLGEDEWRSIDVSWMPARARTDLGAVGTKWRHEDPYMLAGLWRLDLERETVLESVAAHDGDAVWPLATPGNRFPLGRESDFPFLWRPRLERWYRAQPAGEAAERLRGKLAATRAEAVASKDVELEATILEAMDERFGRESAEALASEALGLIRQTVADLEARIRVDPWEYWGRVPTALMERIGVPDDVDLRTIAHWTRRCEQTLQGEAIPLPHPYDLHLLVLRLQRLLDRGPTRLPIEGVIRDEQGRPIPRAWIEVEGYPKPLQSPPAWDSDVRGRFQIDGVPRGPVKLHVTTGDIWAPSSPKKVIMTRAGVRDLVIVVDPGPQLFLRIVDYVPGEQVRGARVTWEEPDGKRDWRWTPIRDDGWARFVALPPDREVEVWAEAEVNRRHVRASGLKPGPTEQRIERQEVKDIAGKVLGPVRRHKDFMITVDVYAQPRGAFGGLSVARAWPDADGSFRVRGLPPGTYLVDIGSRAGEIFSVSKAVEAGTTDAIFDLD